MSKNIALSLTVFIICLELGLRTTGLYTTFSEGSTESFWFEWNHERESSHYSHNAKSVFISSNGESEWEYHTNQFGYRERHLVPKKDSIIRLFTIGDSFTEGLGTSFDSTWPRRLEDLLKQQGIDLDLHNCGMSGSDPFYQWWSLQNKLIEHEPSHVIVSINDSDFDDIIIRGGYSRFQPNGSVKYRPAPWFLPIYRFSHIIRMIVHELFDYDYYLIRRHYADRQRAEVADSIARCLRDISQLCAENDVKFMGVIHPVPHLICYESEHSKSNVLALDSHSFDFPVIRMYEPLKAAMTGPDCTSYHWKQDSHFNGKGYQLFGNLLFEQIEQNYPDFWSMNGSSGPSVGEDDTTQFSTNR